MLKYWGARFEKNYSDYIIYERFVHFEQHVSRRFRKNKIYIISIEAKWEGDVSIVKGNEKIVSKR